MKKFPVEFEGKYKEHEIIITREKGDDWYILVTAPDGTHAYDGWWPESRSESLGSALNEAIIGSLL